MGLEESKNKLNKYLQVMDKIEAMSEAPLERKIKLRDCFVLECENLLAYLSLVDGFISGFELRYMNYLFDIHFTEEQYEDLSERGKEYEILEKPPLSLMIVKKVEEKYDLQMVDSLIGFLETIGKELVACDGDIDDSEMEELDKYISMLHKEFGKDIKQSSDDIGKIQAFLDKKKYISIANIEDYISFDMDKVYIHNWYGTSIREKKYEIKEKNIYFDGLKYTISGNYLLQGDAIPCVLPGGNKFNLIVENGTEKYIFKNDGTVQWYVYADESRNGLLVLDDGTYERTSELVRLNMYCKKKLQGYVNYMIFSGNGIFDQAYLLDSEMNKLDFEFHKESVEMAEKAEKAKYESFFKKCRCPKCSNVGWWENIWGNDNFTTAKCIKCGYNMCSYINDDGTIDIQQTNQMYERIERENVVKKIAPWDTQYYDHPCPYCGKYKVRAAKWEDKQFSTAFWGAFSRKLHCHYKCDNCKEMWE